jgi:hypothetical protein
VADLGEGDGVWPRKADPVSGALVIALAMDIAGEADEEDEVDRDGGREFRSGAISFIFTGGD